MSDKLNIIDTIRESGNYFFSKKNYVEADRKYKKGIRYIQYWTCNTQLDPLTNAEFCTQLEKAKISCMLNSAAAALKKGLFRQSLNLCNEVNYNNY